MDELDVNELLKKYKDGTITGEERLLLERWYVAYVNKSPYNMDEEALEHIFGQLKTELFPSKNNKIRRLLPRIAAAASIILVLALTGFWWFQKSKIIPPPITENKPTIQDIAPGGNKAVLTLSDGSKIAVTDAAAGTLAQQGNSVIQKTEKGSLVYNSTESEKGANLTNTLSTPPGGETSLTLADGTEVKLDAASSITFPVAFNGNERKVKVTGQAYFKVKHNDSKPFIVIAGEQMIKDIGTEFNINAYNNIKTTLVEGSVKVNDKFLSPGQQAVSSGKNIVIKKANIEEVTSWATGYFRFENEDIHSVMDKISRWYNIEVVYEPGVTADGITGTISRFKNISQVFYMLSYGQNIHFKIDGRRVTVMR